VLSQSGYLYSILYVSLNLLVVVLAGFTGWALLKYRYKTTYQQLRPIFSVLCRNSTFLGFAMAIVMHNAAIALVLLMYQEQIWWYDITSTI
jgi:hypothetical protein